ncbi:MAG TPA: hypothetical protein VLM79_23695 [Kofleriaceae bacterium]|nr:hypothetical protein [Kofleriaceae bacterium]
MRTIALVAVLTAHGLASAGPQRVRCDDLSTAELAIDGMLDDWPAKVLARAGSGRDAAADAVRDAAIDLRCAWDGGALALALEVADDRVVRLAKPSARAHEDHLEITVAAGGRPVAIAVYPGNAVARSRIIAPPGVAVADSLQPHGFSVEVRVPAAALAGLSDATPALELLAVFHDADRATGGDDTEVELAAAIELGDRKDLLEDFLRAARIKKSDLRLDVLADLDPDRKGKERLVAGGAVIGVLTDRFAFVTLPVKRQADIKHIDLVPLGPRGLDVISAVVTQGGNGGSRDLLLLWTVWSGQLQPLAQIEVRKQLAGNLLEAGWRIVKGRRGPELWVEPRPPSGWTAETWNEVPADDADPIVLPWDPTRGGVAYRLTGAELARRDLPPPRSPPRSPPRAPPRAPKK